jgi:hypothetical protein
VDLDHFLANSNAEDFAPLYDGLLRVVHHTDSHEMYVNTDARGWVQADYSDSVALAVNGRFVTGFDYFRHYSMGGGRATTNAAAVSKTEMGVGMWVFGILNANGEEIVPFEFRQILVMTNNTAIVQTVDSKWGIIAFGDYNPADSVCDCELCEPVTHSGYPPNPEMTANLALFLERLEESGLELSPVFSGGNPISPEPPYEVIGQGFSSRYGLGTLRVADFMSEEFLELWLSSVREHPNGDTVFISGTVLIVWEGEAMPDGLMDFLTLHYGTPTVLSCGCNVCDPTDVFEPDMSVEWESEGQGVHFNSLHGFVEMFERGRGNVVSDDGLHRIDESIINYENILLPLPLDNFTLRGAGMRRVVSGLSTDGEQRYDAEISFDFFSNDGTMSFILVEAQGSFRNLNERIEEYERLVEQGYTGIPTVREVNQVLILQNRSGERSVEFWYNGKIYTLSWFTFFNANGDWDSNRQLTERELIDLAGQIHFVNWSNRAVALEAERAAIMAARGVM